jgi:hypothetical protein
MTVDEFVEAKVQAEFQPIVAAIRGLMRECAPDAQEAISYRMPVFKQRKIFAWIGSTKREITLGFSRGAQMEDRYNLLRGVGKGSKHLKMKSLGEVNKPSLRYYIKQAVNLDKL